MLYLPPKTTMQFVRHQVKQVLAIYLFEMLPIQSFHKKSTNFSLVISHISLIICYQYCIFLCLFYGVSARHDKCIFHRQCTLGHPTRPPNKYTGMQHPIKMLIFCPIVIRMCKYEVTCLIKKNRDDCGVTWSPCLMVRKNTKSVTVSAASH